MKRFSLCILVLGMLLLCACSASDSSETDISSGSEGIQSHESGDTSQTEPKNILESQDPAKTDSEMSAVSDRNEIGEGSRPSASPKEPGKSTPVKQQADGNKSDENSQAPAGSSEPKQNESAAQTEAPKEPAAEPPAAAQQPSPEPVAPEKPVEQPPEPEKPKSIYDYAFDADAIRSELIAIGQSLGLTHITEDDGIPCTPDTCSWASPVTASESFQGDNLKRALQNYVTSMPSTIASYGGTQMESFTIYVQDNGGGSYTFYFLY
ncbi:hypothetical protein [Enterocloster bolteae]|uniref:hypothetical protein n=1 Tax=Enterocloster bolteae TaxID=208479 RepID=UPI0028DBE7B0|nr:hypothetical protein [Enterocloster bolteae]